LTCAIKKYAAFAGMAGFFCVTAHAAIPSFTATREITSNNVYSFAGHGDTLCMVTEGGVNFTLATSDSLSWFGYKTDQFSGAISFGDGALAATLRPVSQNVTPTSAVLVNQVWLFHFPALASGMLDAKNVVVVDSIFSQGNHLGKVARNADFSVVDVAWSKGAFWLACTDGGLARLDIANNSARAFIPGRKKGFPPSRIADSSGIVLDSFPDTTKRVIGVTVQDSSVAPVVWAVTPVRLWKFSYRDSSWDSTPSFLADPNLTFVNYCNAYARTLNGALELFASIAAHKNKNASVLDTMFFRFNPLKNSWTTCLANGPFSLTFGQGDEVYVNYNNYINLYQEASAGDTLVISGKNTSDVFQTRMTKANGGYVPDNINGMLFLPQTGAKASLWIASSANVLPSAKNGIFYSFDELSDEQNATAFKYIHSDKKLTAGLKESYAFPGVLNSLNGGKAMFAYNLSKASKVTIKIYDWNMDPVKTVIKERDRPAGNDRANGRSTNAAEDTWDGTTDSGRRVAVGVYYYKISAQSGEHAFGKIIVAK
jgi:hypothetical protein